MKYLKVSLILPVIFLFAMPGCKPKDAEIQTHINDQLKEFPELDRVSATVADRMVTLEGQVKEITEKNNAESIVKNVNGVDSVKNNITVEINNTPSSTILQDDDLMNAVKPLLKGYPDVTATVSGGIITLTGSAKTDKQQALLDTLKTLHPIGIENKMTSP